MEDDQYGMSDLRQFISGRSLYPPPSEFLPTHRSFNTPPPHPFEMLMDCVNSAGTRVATVNNSSMVAAVGCGVLGGVGMETGGGDGCAAGRWPRQETLTLLEIRSRLDAKFKESNQKGPLWDEVSRILSEEHGYHRSGKKCREKFENLYKYYKKTKEGKAGRQDGKHYRFFRQLEALYGETTIANNSASGSETHFNHAYNFPNKKSFSDNKRESCPAHMKISETAASLSLSDHYSDDTSLSDDSSGINNNVDAAQEKKKSKTCRRSWKAKIRDFVDSKVKRLIDKQEVWMEKMMRTMENKEQERLMREEEWRKQDAARIESEHKFWASERAWIEARDATLMEALQKVSAGREELKSTTSQREEAAAGTAPEIGSQSYNQLDDANSARGCDYSMWPDSEISRLFELRSGMETKFQQRGWMSEEQLWSEISSKMACFGHDRSGSMCKNKWDSVSYHLRSNKKRKDHQHCSNYYNYHNNHEYSNYNNYNHGGSCDTSEQGMEHLNSSSAANNYSSSSMNGGNANINDGCLGYLMSDGYGRI